MNKKSKAHSTLLLAIFFITAVPNFLQARYSLYQRYSLSFALSAFLYRRMQFRHPRFFRQSFRRVRFQEHAHVNEPYEETADTHVRNTLYAGVGTPQRNRIAQAYNTLLANSNNEISLNEERNLGFDLFAGSDSESGSEIRAYFGEDNTRQAFILHGTDSRFLEQPIQEVNTITRLTIRDTHITRNALLALMRWSSLEEINLVNVTFDNIDASAITEALEAFSLNRLMRFSILNTRLNDGYVRVLYEILKLCSSNLYSLAMSNVGLRDQNLALLTTINFDHLVRLDLSANQLTDEAMRILANSQWVQTDNLDILDVQNNAHISQEGIAILEEESHIGHVENTVTKRARRE